MHNRFFKKYGIEIQFSSERGVALFLALAVISLTLAAVLATAAIFLREFRIAQDIRFSSIAIIAADAGIEAMLYDEWRDDAYCPGDPTETCSATLANAASYSVTLIPGSPRRITSRGEFRSVKRAIEVTF